MQQIKKLIIILIILGGLFFLFAPEVVPENLQPQEILDVATNKDVIIIFNPGGWGNTTLEKAEDFAPIIKGIELTLNGCGYNSIVIPYIRTKDNLFGKITGVKEFFNSFHNSSKDLSERIEFITKNFPDKKIIIAGLSNGASFVNKTYGKIPEEVRDSVYAIAVGAPFWTDTPESNNVLQLSNKRKDTLVKGEIGSLFLALVRTPFVGAFRATGHDYFWESPEVSSQIITFLESKFR